MTEEPEFAPEPIQEPEFEEELIEDLPELDTEDEDFAGEDEEEPADF